MADVINIGRLAGDLPAARTGISGSDGGWHPGAAGRPETCARVLSGQSAGCCRQAGQPEPEYSAVNQPLDNQKDQQCRQDIGDIAAHELWKLQPFAGVGFFLIVFISPAKAGDTKQQIAE